MSKIKELNINLAGLALLTPILMEYISIQSQGNMTLPAFVIFEILNAVLLYRSVYGAKQNESGAVLAFVVSLHAVVATAVMFGVFYLF